jgi:hypothetical protein
MSEEDKVRENRLRRIAERRGYSLEKSRRRDHKAPDFGRFRLVSVREGHAVVGDEPIRFSATLEDIEEWLGERPEPEHGAVVAEITQVLKKLQSFERKIGFIEDELGLKRSSPSDPWKDRLERIRSVRRP